MQATKQMVLGRHTGLCIVIITIYLGLATGFALQTPVFEAPDENHHFYTAHYIAETGQLPIAAAGTLPRQEAAQPPLYYLMTSLLIAPWDTSTLAFPAYNSRTKLGSSNAVVNRNAFFHTPAERWPGDDMTWVVRRVRFFSILLGFISLLAIYVSTRLLLPHQPDVALGATALVTCLPQWNALHGAVTNDALIITTSCLTLTSLLWLWRQGITPMRLVLLGSLIGLAILSKLVGLMLLGFSLLWVSALCWRKCNWGQLASVLTLITAPAVLLSAWLFWRNWRLYQDPTAVNQFIALAGGERQLPLAQIVHNLGNFWRSFIAAFGWMNVFAPTWLYGAWVFILLSCGVGLLWSVLRSWQEMASGGGGNVKRRMWFKQPPRALLFLLVWTLLVTGSWFQFNLRTPAEQGRLLFPGILPVAILLGYGLAHLPKWVAGTQLVVALGTALYCLIYLLPQAFAIPQWIDPAAVPSDVQLIHQPLAQGVNLVASKIEPDVVKPDETVMFTLYWQRHAHVATPAIISMEIIGRDYQPIGTRPDAYHGGGIYPSTLWPLDTIVREEGQIVLQDEIAAPVAGRILVDSEGQTEPVEVGRVKIVPATWPSPAPTVIGYFAPGIEVANVHLDKTTVRPRDNITLTLQWQITAAITQSLTTFVHLSQPGQPPISQADSLPLNGDYPTSYWRPGEVFVDHYSLMIPDASFPGSYQVTMGLYDAQSGNRVPLEASEQPVQDNALMVGTMVIRK